MKQMKMVIIDDEPIILRGLAETYPWDEMGFDIVGTATKPDKGLELIKEKRPQVVLSDIRMAKMSGLTLVDKVKEFDENIIFILMSAYKEFEYARQACDLGVFAYLVKPIEEDLLVQTMQSAYELCEKKIEIETEYDYLKEMLCENKGSFHSIIFERYLKEEIDEADFVKALDIRGESISDQDGLIGVCVGFDITSRMLSQEEFEIQASVVFNELRDKIFEQYQGWYLKSSSDRIIFILKVNKAEDMDIIRALINEVEKMTIMELFSAISAVFYGIEALKIIYSRIQEMYNLAYETGLHMLVGEENTTIESNKKYLSEYILKAVQYIDKNLGNEDLNITEVSEYVYLNPVYFGRLFKSELNISFKQYILNKRIELAKKRILEGNNSIVAIGEEVGIPNSSYFTQVFKKTTGYLPSEYRRKITNEAN